MGRRMKKKTDTSASSRQTLLGHLTSMWHALSNSCNVLLDSKQHDDLLHGGLFARRVQECSSHLRHPVLHNTRQSCSTCCNITGLVPHNSTVLNAICCLSATG
jgi:hypothetical protein